MRKRARTRQMPRIAKENADARDKKVAEELQRAQDLSNKGDFAGAIAACKAAREIDPQNRQANKELKRAEKALAVAQKEAAQKDKIPVVAASAQVPVANQKTNSGALPTLAVAQNSQETKVAVAEKTTSLNKDVSQPTAVVANQAAPVTESKPVVIAEAVPNTSAASNLPAEKVETVAPAPAPTPVAPVSTPVAAPSEMAVPSPAPQATPMPITTPTPESAAPAAGNMNEPQPVAASANSATTAAMPMAPVSPIDPTTRHKIDSMLTEAGAIYAKDRKQVEKSREIWQKVLELDPTNKEARTMIEQTETEQQRLMGDKARRQEATAQERSGEEKLNTPVNVSTNEPTPLVDFLQILSFATGINFAVSEGAEATINATFVDKPLREILDTVLLPIGLKWTREKGDVIVVSADLKTKVFHLTQEEIAKVQRLIEEKSLQRILYGPSAEKPLKNTVLQVDEREGILMAIDSAQNIEKLTKFLQNLKTEQPLALKTNIYTIREDQGPEIKALVDALINVDKTPYDLERSVFVSGKNLIIKDTPEHLRKIEEMLNQKDFLQNLHEGKTQLATFSLIPREAVKGDTEMVSDFAAKTVEVIETLLYAEGGKAKAMAEGRRLWFDPTTFQLTLIDYPDRISAVADFIASLPQIKQQAREKVIRLKNLESSDMETRLKTVLGLEGAAGEEGGTQN